MILIHFLRTGLNGAECSSTCATLSSKTFWICTMLCLNSLTSFFNSSVCCFEISKILLIILNKFFYLSSSALVIIFSIRVINFCSRTKRACQTYLKQPVFLRKYMCALAQPSNKFAYLVRKNYIHIKYIQHI